MPRLTDFIFRPIASTLGLLIGTLVHPKSSYYFAVLTKDLKGTWGNLPGWKDEVCPVGDIELKGVSFTPKNYEEKNGVIICFWGNGDFYQTKQNEMFQFGNKFNKKVISYNNRGVINTETRAPIGESDIIQDAVAIAKKHINDDNRDGSLLYGHSLGGAQAVKAGYQLLTEGKAVKVYSWNSFRSVSATAREMLAPLARPLNVAIGVLSGAALSVAATFFLPTLGFGILVGATSGFAISLTTALLSAGKSNKAFAYSMLLNPLLRLAGWDLNCEMEGSELLKANKLHYGNIDFDQVIKPSAQFADAMDPLLEELLKKQPPPLMAQLNTRYIGFNHMDSPHYHEDAYADIATYLGPKLGC